MAAECRLHAARPLSERCSGKVARSREKLFNSDAMLPEFRRCGHVRRSRCDRPLRRRDHGRLRRRRIPRHHGLLVRDRSTSYASFTTTATGRFPTGQKKHGLTGEDRGPEHRFDRLQQRWPSRRSRSARRLVGQVWRIPHVAAQEQRQRHLRRRDRWKLDCCRCIPPRTAAWADYDNDGWLDSIRRPRIRKRIRVPVGEGRSTSISAIS